MSAITSTEKAQQTNLLSTELAEAKQALKVSNLIMELLSKTDGRGLEDVRRGMIRVTLVEMALEELRGRRVNDPTPEPEPHVKPKPAQRMQRDRRKWGI